MEARQGWPSWAAGPCRAAVSRLVEARRCCPTCACLAVASEEPAVPSWAAASEEPAEVSNRTPWVGPCQAVGITAGLRCSGCASCLSWRSSCGLEGCRRVSC